MLNLIVAHPAQLLDLERYRKMMHSWAAAAGARPEDTSDAVQEAMIEAYEAQERLANLDDGRRAAWLKTTTKRKVLDADRHRKRAKRGGGNVRSLEELGQIVSPDLGARNRSVRNMEPVADDTSPSRRAEIHELRDRLLAELPSELRDVCILYLKEKQSPEAVARRLGLTREEVGLRLGAGLMQLGKLLKYRSRVDDGRTIR